MDKIEIPLSETKILLIIGGSMLFVVVGINMFTTDEYSGFPPAFLKLIGIVAILFFGATGIYGIIKIFDKNIGLTIDDDGIIDNSSGISVGRINWSDITRIETGEYEGTKFLLIYTTDPEYYIDKVNVFKRKWMEANNMIFGTPLAISSVSLKLKFKDLERLVYDKLQKHRTQTSKDKLAV